MANETRDIILRTIRTLGKASVNDLAEAAGISPVSVRHHLASLQADQLVSTEAIRAGVGRPRYLYSVTDLALDNAPGSYLRLFRRILNQMKDAMPPQVIEQLFHQIAENMAADLAPRLHGQPIEERLQIVQEVLNEEGFDVQIELQGELAIIHERSCPYIRVSRQHPEICKIGQTLMSLVLEIPVERMRWLMSGDQHCTYALPLPFDPEKTIELLESDIEFEQE